MKDKKISFARKMYRNLKEWGIRRLSLVSPKAVSKIRYKQSLGKNLNLANPKEFNEKLMWLKLNTYYKNPRVTLCADKVKVREYIKKRGCGEILVDCIGVYEKASQIPWNRLPNQFVLKCNHGSGYNFVCTDKNKINIKEVEKELCKWLKKDYSLPNAEMQYHYIKPLIICEKYLQPVDGILPDDYKVYCFNGKAEGILLCKERETGKCRLYFYDRDWNGLCWIGTETKESHEKIKKPVCLKELLHYAEKLSKGFPFVRVDFYVLGGRVYFGEMTFTPYGCVDPDYTEEGNRELSKKLILPL